MNSNEFVERTKSFAVECVKLTDIMPGTNLANHIRGQLIRCATSTAANYRATRLAQSNAAFVAKLSIVIEEVDESEFWIDFALGFNLLNQEDAKPIIQEAHDLASIFIASRKTIQTRNKK
jgi:four helix bundle protein